MQANYFGTNIIIAILRVVNQNSVAVVHSATLFMNGLFDYYTLEPLKGYYPFLIYSNLKDIGTEAESVSDDGTVYSVCAYDGKRAAIMLTYYSEDDDVLNKSVTITAEGFDLDNARVYITDEENTMSLYPVRTFENNTLTLFLKRNSIVYIEK